MSAFAPLFALFLGACALTAAPPTAASEAAALLEAANAEQRAAVMAVEAAALAARSAARPGAERMVVEADLAFAADARSLGVRAAFAKWAAPQAKLVGGGAVVPTGPDAIAEEFPEGSFGWWWAPKEVHAQGDVGVTMGEAAILSRGPDGAVRLTRTRYVTAWRRGDDGWKFVLDMGAPITAAR